MMREDFKLLAYGQYAFSRRCETVVKKDMDLFVEGAMFAFDFLAKVQAKAKIQAESQLELAEVVQKPAHQN